MTSSRRLSGRAILGLATITVLIPLLQPTNLSASEILKKRPQPVTKRLEALKPKPKAARQLPSISGEREVDELPAELPASVSILPVSSDIDSTDHSGENERKEWRIYFRNSCSRPVTFALSYSTPSSWKTLGFWKKDPGTVILLTQEGTPLMTDSDRAYLTFYQGKSWKSSNPNKKLDQWPSTITRDLNGVSITLGLAAGDHNNGGMLIDYQC